DLVKAVERAGYEASIVSDSQDGTDELAARHAAEQDRLKRDTLLAVALALPVFILEMGSHLLPAFHHFIEQAIGRQANWTVQFILTSVALVVPGRRFFTIGIPA